MAEQPGLDHKLKTEKLSFTQQRRVILEEVEKKDCHLTADEIYFLVKKRMPKVSVGTIYRNLSVLVDLNLIDKLKTSIHDESYYETHKEAHYHVICTKCKRIDDLEHYRALSVEPTAEKITNYKISNHLIELHGICPVCRNHDSLNENYSESQINNSKPIAETKISSQIKNPVLTPNTAVEKNEIQTQNPNQTENNSKNLQRKKFFFGRRNIN